MGSYGSAHGLSLQIYTTIKWCDEDPPAEVCAKLNAVVSKLLLQDDVEVCVVFVDEHTHVSLEPLSEFGQRVLEEVLARSTFAPCAPGSCERVCITAPCKWCGEIPQ